MNNTKFFNFLEDEAANMNMDMAFQTPSEPNIEIINTNKIEVLDDFDLIPTIEKEEKQEEKTEELSAEAQAMLDEIFEKYEKLAQDYTQALEKITALESKVEELSAKPDDKPEEKADDKPKEKLNENPTTEEAIRLFLNSMGTMAANGAQEKTDTPTDPIWGV